MDALLVEKINRYMRMKASSPEQLALVDEIIDLIGGEIKFKQFLGALNEIQNLARVFAEKGGKSDEFTDTLDVIKMVVDPEIFDIAHYVFTNLKNPKSN
jgi:hypothetical protein